MTAELGMEQEIEGEKFEEEIKKNEEFVSAKTDTNEFKTNPTPEDLKPKKLEMKLDKMKEFFNKVIEKQHTDYDVNTKMEKEKIREYIRGKSKGVVTLDFKFLTEKAPNETEFMSESRKKYIDKSVDTLFMLKENGMIDTKEFDSEIDNLKELKNLSKEQQYFYDKNLITMVRKIELFNNTIPSLVDKMKSDLEILMKREDLKDDEKKIAEVDTNNKIQLLKSIDLYNPDLYENNAKMGEFSTKYNENKNDITSGFNVNEGKIVDFLKTIRSNNADRTALEVKYRENEDMINKAFSDMDYSQENLNLYYMGVVEGNELIKKENAIDVNEKGFGLK